MDAMGSMHRNMQVCTTLNANHANKIILLQWKIRKLNLLCDGDDGGVGAEIERGFTEEIFLSEIPQGMRNKQDSKQRKFKSTKTRPDVGVGCEYSRPQSGASWAHNMPKILLISFHLQY